MITGGTFSSDVTSYLTSGMQQDSNGTVIVNTATAVASIDGAAYASLADAINAAQDGDTITLLKNITLDTNLTIDKSVTIEGANAGIPWNSTQRKAETTITAYTDQATNNEGGRIVIADGKNVTFDGVSIAGNYTADVAAPMIGMIGTAKLTIQNSIVADTGADHSSGYGLINTMACTAGSKLTITNSRLTGVLGDESGNNPPTYYIIGGGTCELDIQNNLFETGRWVIFGTTASGIFSNNEVVKSPTAPESAFSSVINSGNLNGLTISHNTFDESLVGTRFVISGNYDIKDNVFENLGEDLALYIMSVTGQSASITGNTFHLADTSEGICFVDGEWSTGGDVSKVQITGNTFHGKGVYQIKVDEGEHWTGVADAMNNNYPDGVNVAGNVLALDLSGGDLGGNVTITEENGIYYVTLPAPTRTGYTFIGWSNNQGVIYKAGTKVPLSIAQDLTAQWIVTEQPSTPGGETTPVGDYIVNVDKVSGGKVTVNPGRADRGDEVTITAIPNAGYELDTITVTSGGSSVRVIYAGGDKYTFTMPSGSVTVTATFVKDGQAAADLPFTDVPESYWAYDEIRWAYESGYINGSTAATFNPGGTITRQQVWMILARMSGSNPADMAAAKAWAVESGISDGSNPGSPVTRQQLAALLYRFAVSEGMTAVTPEEHLSSFPDAADVSSYAVQAMNWTVAEGIIGGTTEGTLNPTGPATRAQFCVMLWRFVEG